MAIVRLSRPIRPQNRLADLTAFSALVEQQAVFCMLAERQTEMCWSFLHNGESDQGGRATAIAFVSSAFAWGDEAQRATQFAAFLAALFYRGFRDLIVSQTKPGEFARIHAYLGQEMIDAFIWSNGLSDRVSASKHVEDSNDLGTESNAS